MNRQGARAATMLVLAFLSACSRAKDGGAREGGVGASASASAFVWPLAGPVDGGEPAVPRRGMIWIPPGTLVAGTPRERTPRVADEELPGDAVDLSGFYIDEFAYPNEAGAIPKTGMTRDEAAGLCASQEKRLCTELEWERACKGSGNTVYEYGDSYRAAECTMGLPGRLAPSGLRVACKSAFGVHDLHGGPWEWTASVWRRGGDSQIGAARGGNSEAGELAGRCANALAIVPASRRSDLGARCCAGNVNPAEVRLAVTRKKALEVRYNESALATVLADAVREKAPPELPSGKPFRIDRVWFWHPVGNEELLVAAGCAKMTAHLSCGVGVFRPRSAGSDSDAAPGLVAFASSGWWMPVVKTDHRDHDLWVFGGDGSSSFRRRVAYVWGRVALGEPERTTRMTTD
jgi:sulfatase modifying factor 1